MENHLLMKKDNRIILDLAKCQWSRFGYINQYGQWRDTEQKLPTIRGESIYPDEPAHYHVQYPGETVAERARRLGLIDVWTPQITFKLVANEYIVYTGQRALTMRDAWGARIFKKKVE